MLMTKSAQGSSMEDVPSNRSISRIVLLALHCRNSREEVLPEPTALSF
jgi:hypothetical protein